MIDINLYKKNQQVEFLSPDGKSKRRATIIKEIGGGATSIVYKAKLDDETLAAVKSYREIESKTRNYQNEVSALRLLSQFPDTTKPITPIFLGHSEELDDTARFVVMEFITAPSLEKRFAEGILSEKDACHLGIQLFEFIQILHENKKSYPDIKKENFRWEDSRLRVIDIGALGENPDDNMVRRDLFQAGLIFLGQCIVNMPDYDRLLFKLSGQPLEEILNADSSSLSGGIKYVFTHLFHNDYDQRYKTPQDIISDLKILYGAHVKDKKEVCATLQTQIEQAAKGVLSPEERWQKKKEVFIISSVLSLSPNKDDEVLKILKNAKDSYRQSTLDEGILKFKTNPSRAKNLFQEIIKGEDFEQKPNVIDSAWRWFWACLMVKNNPDARAHLEELLLKIDENSDKPFTFQPGTQTSYLDDTSYGYILNQVSFLEYFKQRNLEQAENFLKKLPDEYQNTRRAELQGLQQGRDRQKELSSQLDKIKDFSADYPGMLAEFIDTRRKLESINSANLWWDAIQKAAEALAAKEEYKQGEAIIQIGLTYPGYPKKMADYLKLTKSLALMQLDLALGDVVHAATVWSKQADSKEIIETEAFKQKMLKFRDAIYLKGDLIACGILEEYFSQTPEAGLTVAGENNKSWEEIKAGMQPTLKSNGSAVQSLFNRLTSGTPVLGENLDFPVRLLLRDQLETPDEINYKKALLEDAYSQLLSIPGKNPEELKIKRDQGIKVLNEKSKKMPPVSFDPSEKRKEIKAELDSCEQLFKTLQADASRMLDEGEEFRKKTIVLMDDIYQLLRDFREDKILQDWMQRALKMLGADPNSDILTLFEELKKRSPLKEKLDKFARGEASDAEVKKQLQKEVFRDKNEYQNYLSCITNLLQLKKLETAYKESDSFDAKKIWVSNLVRSDLLLPAVYWKSSLARRFLEEMKGAYINVGSKKDELKNKLLLGIYANKVIEKMDAVMLSDKYLEN